MLQYNIIETYIVSKKKINTVKLNFQINDF